MQYYPVFADTEVNENFITHAVVASGLEQQKTNFEHLIMHFLEWWQLDTNGNIACTCLSIAYLYQKRQFS